jgi:hypothetical protein
MALKEFYMGQSEPYDLEGLPHRVQSKVAGIPHRESQALVTTIRQAGGFAAISRWLSASDTTGLWNNKDAHPGGVPPAISIERFSINANGRRCDPSGVRSFSPHADRGWSGFAPPPANGLQAFGLNEASSLTVREQSRDCPPLLNAPLPHPHFGLTCHSRAVEDSFVRRIQIQVGCTRSLPLAVLHPTY